MLTSRATVEEAVALFTDPDEERARARLGALWSVVIEENPALRNVREVQFFKLRFDTDPELVRLDRPPVEQQLLYTFTPGPGQAAPDVARANRPLLVR